QWFGVRDLGKVYAPAVRGEAAYLVDVDCVEGSIGIGVDGLVASAHAITRVGPAEGLVTVGGGVEVYDWDKCVEAPVGKVEHLRCPYFPYSGGLSEPWTSAEFLDWRDVRTWTDERLSAGRVTYAVPSGVWAEAQPEFPRCATLKDFRFKLCGGRCYPYAR
ncbi:hypothetical protein, partial [Pyrobaculum sp.]|uniref:hypothetical protein n=1 Tax=Pyrobaculum sp. TaxID=2004705 RepID=UPI003D132C38